MPASALGCLCLVQLYGQLLNPLNKERKSGKDGCFPFQKWYRAFHISSPYLSLTNVKERDVLEFWRQFSASSQWEEVWKPWTESLGDDDIRARCYYMSWLPSVDEKQRLKWGNAFTESFRFKDGPFGFEIVEVLNRPDRLDVDSTTDPSSSDMDSSSSSSSSDAKSGNVGQKVVVGGG